MPEQRVKIAQLMELPDRLRITVVAVSGMGEASADEVALKTGRSRTLESSYLNYLVKIGHLRKMKRGRRIYFSTTYTRKSVPQLMKRLGLEAI